jgi:hypothetical protein
VALTIAVQSRVRSASCTVFKDKPLPAQVVVPFARKTPLFLIGATTFCASFARWTPSFQAPIFAPFTPVLFIHLIKIVLVYLLAP